MLRAEGFASNAGAAYVGSGAERANQRHPVVIQISGLTAVRILTDHGYQFMARITSDRFWTGAALALAAALGVFFLMGYVVARSKPKGKVTAAQPGKPQGAATGLPPASAESHEHDGPPQPGRYLQVAAIDRPGATALAEAYRRHGFQVVIRPTSLPSVLRVLIGPFESDNEIVTAKARLKAIGINTPLLRSF